MKAFILNCTLKPSPSLSNTEALADVLREELEKRGVDTEIYRLADYHVAGFVSTGNEDGAKHTIGEMIALLVELGFTVPGQPWTYWNNGVSMGDDYVDSDDTKGKERAASNAKLAAHVLVETAQALAAKPIAHPPS